MPVQRLCKTQNTITVNGQFPGPTLEVRNGDHLVIKVVNRARYNVTIHWHGILQRRTAWADGPEFVTQCSIRPGRSYTYRFSIEEQEGTFWWHAHSSWLRATVYGALLIYPKVGSSYPFIKPKDTQMVMIQTLNKFHNNQVILLQDVCRKMAINLMVTQLLGMWSESDINEMAQLFSDFVDGCISVPINLPGFHYHTAMKAREKIIKKIDKTIETRRQRPASSEVIYLTNHSVNCLWEHKKIENFKL